LARKSEKRKCKSFKFVKEKSKSFWRGKKRDCRVRGNYQLIITWSGKGGGTAALPCKSCRMHPPPPPLPLVKEGRPSAGEGGIAQKIDQISARVVTPPSTQSWLNMDDGGQQQTGKEEGRGEEPTMKTTKEPPKQREGRMEEEERERRRKVPPVREWRCVAFCSEDFAK
jgi:hypothetical protein